MNQVKIYNRWINFTECQSVDHKINVKRTIKEEKYKK